MVASWRLAVVLQMLPHPVGGIGIERGRRLVQQQQLRLVDQRLRQRDAGLLPGRELAVGAVEEIAEIEIGGELLDALGADSQPHRAGRTW